MKSKVTITYDIDFEIEISHEPGDEDLESIACEMVESKFKGLNHTIHDVCVDIEEIK